ncbi:hypothetical protein HN682_07785 [Candidatus Peregrinibacteria bacterium]|jgi:hypothetical protein|nr:hypothetical protein [Candidatus Peregrinibacteria bacterium]
MFVNEYKPTAKIRKQNLIELLFYFGFYIQEGFNVVYSVKAWQKKQALVVSKTRMNPASLLKYAALKKAKKPENIDFQLTRLMNIEHHIQMEATSPRIFCKFAPYKIGRYQAIMAGGYIGIGRQQLNLFYGRQLVDKRLYLKDYDHPHSSSGNDLCMGNNYGNFQLNLKQYQLLSAIRYMFGWITTYNPKDPYRSLSESNIGDDNYRISSTKWAGKEITTPTDMSSSDGLTGIPPFIMDTFKVLTVNMLSKLKDDKTQKVTIENATYKVPNKRQLVWNSTFSFNNQTIKTAMVDGVFSEEVFFSSSSIKEQIVSTIEAKVRHSYTQFRPHHTFKGYMTHIYYGEYDYDYWHFNLVTQNVLKRLKELDDDTIKIIGIINQEITDIVLYKHVTTWNLIVAILIKLYSLEMINLQTSLTYKTNKKVTQKQVKDFYEKWNEFFQQILKIDIGFRDKGGMHAEIDYYENYERQDSVPVYESREFGVVWNRFLPEEYSSEARFPTVKTTTCKESTEEYRADFKKGREWIKGLREEKGFTWDFVKEELDRLFQWHVKNKTRLYKYGTIFTQWRSDHPEPKPKPKRSVKRKYKVVLEPQTIRGLTTERTTPANTIFGTPLQNISIDDLQGDQAVAEGQPEGVPQQVQGNPEETQENVAPSSGSESLRDLWQNYVQTIAPDTES